MQPDEALRVFIGDKEPGVDARDLSAACYTASEKRMWPDYVDSVSLRQAIMCWRLVEALRGGRLPDDAKM